MQAVDDVAHRTAQDAGHGDLQRLAAAKGSQNLPLLQGAAQLPVIGLNCFQVRLFTGGRRIGHHGSLIAPHLLQKNRRSLNIRLANIHVVDLQPSADGGYLTGIELAHGR